MNQINWLHISDTHIKEENFDRDTVISALLEDIRRRTERIDSHLERIDFVFITGDLVFSGRKDEYDIALQRLIKPLAQELGIDNLSQRIFLVPGNHDIDRSQSRGTRQVIRDALNRENAPNTLQTLMNDNELALMLEPQTAYVEFFSDTFDTTRLLSPCKYYARHISIGKGNVAVIGLNSAWLAHGDDDRGNLILGEIQVAKALEHCTDTDFVICLLHHPFDWFNPNNPDTQQCKSRLISKSHVILHGHLHTPDLIAASSLDGDTIIIPAGAIFTTREAPLSYNFASLNLDSGAGTVFFRRYSNTRREWVKDVDSTGNDADGKWNFSTQPLQPPNVLPSTQIVPLLPTQSDEEEVLENWDARIRDIAIPLSELLHSGLGYSNRYLGILSHINIMKNNPLKMQPDAIIQLAASMNEHTQDMITFVLEVEPLWQSLYKSLRSFLSLESDVLRHWLTTSKNSTNHLEEMTKMAEVVVEYASEYDDMLRQLGNEHYQFNPMLRIVMTLDDENRNLKKAARKLDRAKYNFQVILEQIGDDMVDLARLSKALPSTLDSLVAISDSQPSVLEWEGVYIGMPADDVLVIHPKSERTEDTVQLRTDPEDLVVRWSYPGAYLIMSRWEQDGVYCYRVREIHLRDD